MTLALALPAVFFFLFFAILAVFVNAFIIHFLSQVFKFKLVNFVKALQVSILVGVLNFLISLALYFVKIASYILDAFFLVLIVVSTFFFSRLIYKESPKMTIYFALSVIALDIVVGVLVGSLLVLLFNFLNIPFL
ncbi:hypothetical protein KY329_01310 [Candidatus Woesearchaeota archaeon]|nr:hypothetical protein [Candidatus Woesearchaeota archaeon]